MDLPRIVRRTWPLLVVGGAIAAGTPMVAGNSVFEAQTAGEQVETRQIAPKHHLISTPTANMLLFAGRDATVVVGVQRAALVAAAKRLVQEIGAANIRHVLVLEDEQMPNVADGWATTGAVTIAHENLIGRMVRSTRFSHSHEPQVNARPALPELAFSEVVQIRTGDEEIHIIHHRSGYTDADVIVHYEVTNVVHLGNTFTMDGYPAIHVDRGGDLDGMIATAESFIRKAAYFSTPMTIVPGRGRVSSSVRELRDYRDMLVAVRTRVRQLIADGKTEDELVAAAPTKEFDVVWGKGPVPPDAFAAMVYRSLARNRPSSR